MRGTFVHVRTCDVYIGVLPGMCHCGTGLRTRRENWNGVKVRFELGEDGLQNVKLLLWLLRGTEGEGERERCRGTKASKVTDNS